MSANPVSKSRVGRTSLRWAGALTLAMAAVLAGCGGSERVESYEPTRIVSFGDELSLINSDGKKYSVNGFNTTNTTTLDCTVNPIWNQILASDFGLAFPQCPGSVTNANGKMLAAAGAKVADVEAQVLQFRSGDTFVPETMVTVAVGQYDVLEAFQAVQAGTLTLDAAKTQLTALGKRLATVVNEIANGGSGSRVVYSTVPDLVLSPYGRALSSGDQGTLTALTSHFNTEFRSGVTNDGRYVGLVMAEAQVSYVTNYPGSFSVTDVSTAGCTAALPDCTTATLQSAASSSSTYYLWADNTRPGPAFHTRFGAVAVSRARNNPF